MNPKTSKKIRILPMLLSLLLLLEITACGAAGSAEPLASPTGSPSEALSAAASSNFSDVRSGAWYAEAVEYCRQHNVMNGVSDTAFASEDTLTRAMLAAVLHRMSGSPAVSGAPSFQDVKAGTWYTDAVAWAAKNEIVGGYGNGVFGVSDPTTREQAVTILWRYAGSPKAAGAADISDLSSVSTWARDAVQWADASGITDGMLSDRRFDPKANIKRGEVASMLYHYLTKMPNQPDRHKTLVAYFSATGTTRPLAEYAADILNADLYEIVPAEPYTDADLAYYTNGRADREQNDPSARPAISGSVANMEDYDVVLLGYPIWHGQTPRIISTFLESYEFTGKTIVPFCTSHSSGIGSSDTDLHALAGGANWLAGRRFPSGTSRSTIEEWIIGLDLPEPATEVYAVTSAASKEAFDFEAKTVTLNSGYKMPINGLGTYSLHGDTCVDAVKSALASGVRLTFGKTRSCTTLS